ncbi:MAG TPA: primosomal protein N' [Candidatus Omnitrophota bacterium]|nr:primosomal protein N' [Candidatus Omnitrophota bacterium]
MYAEIVLSRATPQLDRIYHYRVPEGFKDKLKVGYQVVIPFGRGMTVGYLIGFSEKADVHESLIKDIDAIKNEVPLFNGNSLALARWMSEHYGCFFISALRTVMPPGTAGKEKRKSKKKLEIKNSKADIINEEDASGSRSPISDLQSLKSPFTLTSAQSSALQKINASVDEDRKETILLYGVTGSGKTEVYIRAIGHALEKGKGSIMLVPEISLTPQMVRRFKERFNDRIAVLHSDLTLKQRDEEWIRIASGEAKIVLGARSAVFAPVADPALVILDEEFETTYKQEKNPRYHAREIAERLGITVVLGSATPAVETFFKARSGEYGFAELPERIERRPLPPVEIVDMRVESEWLLSGKLRDELTQTLSRGEKAILFLNRRGYFTFSVCKACGAVLECPNCSVSLVYHSDEKKLRCGHCDFSAEARVVCPKCGSSSMGFFGTGTQRIEKEVAQAYPDAKIIRYDRDAVIKKGSHETIFAAFAEGNANVLIGTQMVTKGLDVPLVTLVGVVSADTSLNLPDFRAAERTFEQITQVAGRAGRHDLPGKVIVQSLNPEHYALKYARSHDYDGFYKEELEYRRSLFYPPFSRLINIVFSGRGEEKVIEIADKIAKGLSRFMEGKGGKYQVLGPAKAPIFKLRGQYRYQVLVKAEDPEPARAKLFDHLKKANYPADIRIAVDIDPVNLL